MERPSSTQTTTVWRDRRAIALLMAAMLTTMANATISPALPGLQRLFAGEPHAALLTRMLVTAPSLSVALFAPFTGIAADRFGRRPLLIGGVILFALAGSSGLVLADLRAIFASRLVLGIAVALIMTAQTALVGDYFSGSDRNAMTGLQIAARNFGGFLFISIAGWVAALSPRLPFAIYALAALFLPLMWIVITDVAQRPTAVRIDHGSGGGSPTAWRLLFAGLVLLQALTNLLFFIVPTQLPFFFASESSSGAVMTGSALSILMLTGGCVALLYRRIQATIGYAGVFGLGYAAMAFGFSLLILPGHAMLAFAGAAAIGTGYALVSPSFVALALDLAPADKRGMAGGILTASVFVGQFCSPLLTTPILAAAGFSGLFGGAALVLAAMALIAAAGGVVQRLRMVVQL
ncbi:MFS transporter [Mangrovicella endophytica]|uniref:MFS transporter n=1 Tax=Mangrovicella endophytica TaxID=2066697 RepID=UPI000C9EB91C|nr:MFS transporter [Mangrovicella endophytica]